MSEDSEDKVTIWLGGEYADGAFVYDIEDGPDEREDRLFSHFQLEVPREMAEKIRRVNREYQEVQNYLSDRHDEVMGIGKYRQQDGA